MDTCDCGLNHSPYITDERKRNGPAHPDKATLESRMDTYKETPITATKAVELAEAGFFFFDHPDKTVCFHCGVGLHQWEHQDDPWDEHLRHSPRCTYVLNLTSWAALTGNARDARTCTT